MPLVSCWRACAEDVMALSNVSATRVTCVKDDEFWTTANL